MKPVPKSEPSLSGSEVPPLSLKTGFIASYLDWEILEDDLTGKPTVSYTKGSGVIAFYDRVLLQPKGAGVSHHSLPAPHPVLAAPLHRPSATKAFD